MADHTITERTVRRVRVELRTPTNGAEVAKALVSAQQEYREAFPGGKDWDDSLTVTVEDDLLVIWFEVKAR